LIPSRRHEPLSTRLETNVTIFDGVLVLATFLCSLVAGFLFAFAAVVMPGIGRLDDGGFIRAFQVIDRVIQRNQPLFVLVWVGSVLALIAALIAAAAPALWVRSGADRLLIIVVALVYMLGVQLPTVMINVPLNNMLQKRDPDSMDEPTRRRAREDFELRWNRWNALRAACASLTAIVLMVLLVRSRA
jgi:uncharacterized membrane protein